MTPEIALLIYAALILFVCRFFYVSSPRREDE